MVLMGNIAMAWSIDNLGWSVGGWSVVGINLGGSLDGELDELMMNLSEKILDTINSTLASQDYLETLLSTAGEALTSGDSKSAALIETIRQQGGAASFTQLDELYVADSGDHPMIKMSPLLIAGLNLLVAKLQISLEDILDKLIEVLKPVLETVGKWIIKFGDKILDLLSSFSSTLDKVQNQLDQILRQASGSADGVDQMVHETYTLVDMDNSGKVSVTDLEQVAVIYSIAALQGKQPKVLVEQYDDNGDGLLNKEEYKEMVDDDSVPRLMASVLRTYSRKLAEVSGVVARAKMRGEVAKSVVKYFQLVCAKNQTKVGWVSERLTNGSLPLNFTADMLAQMCLMQDDAEALTTKDIGKMVTERMVDFNEGYVMDAYNLMSDPANWVREGFLEEDLPHCVSVVAGWIDEARGNLSSSVLLGDYVDKLDSKDGEEEVELTASGGLVLTQTQRLARRAQLQQHAKAVAKRKLAEYHASRLAARRECRQQRFKTPVSQVLLTHLLGGETPVSNSAGPSNAEMSMNKGVPAVPETLEFAKFLAWNASDTGKRFLKECFDYTGQTTQPLDTFGTQVQTMIKRITSFIKMMMEYATPEGQQRVIRKLTKMAESAMDDLFEVIETKVGVVLVNSSVDIDEKVNDLVDDLEDEVVEKLVDEVEDLLNIVLKPVLKPLGAQVGATVGDAIGEATNSTKLGDVIGDELTAAIGDDVANLTVHAVANEVGKELRNVVDRGIGEVADYINDLTRKLNSSTPTRKVIVNALTDITTTGMQAPRHATRNIALLAGSHRFGEEPDVSGIWDTVATLLVSFTNVMPVAESTLETGRTKVSALAQNFVSVFDSVGTKATRLFHLVSKYWRLGWTLYFLLQAVLLTILTMYALWSTGNLGGDPTPGIEAALGEEDPDPEHRLTCMERIRALCSACCYCCLSMHDTYLCLWSCIILMQVLTLLIFLISLVLCLLAGVKMLLTTGCARVYMLNDANVCTDVMDLLGGFLETFGVDNLPMEEICERKNLLTCDRLMNKMMTSTILTTTGSFLAALLTLQLTVESAVLHERARWRRQYLEYMTEHYVDEYRKAHQHEA